MYFILIMILQLIPAITITGRKPTVLPPLLLIVSVSMLKDFIEERARKDRDDGENTKNVQVVASKNIENCNLERTNPNPNINEIRPIDYFSIYT